jgi:hypothetical protein
MDCSFCKPGQKASQKASDSKCVSETCGPNGVSCPPDKPSCCNDQCTNTQTDPNNCGQCGVQCSQGDTCVNGSCQGGGQGKCSPSDIPVQCQGCSSDADCCTALGDKCTGDGYCCRGTCKGCWPPGTQGCIADEDCCYRCVKERGRPYFCAYAPMEPSYCPPL